MILITSIYSNPRCFVKEVGERECTYAEPVTPSAHPESHDVPDGGTHGRIVPVQVRLLRHIQVEIVLPSCGVAFPG